VLGAGRRSHEVALMGSIEHRRDRPKPYRARYWGLDGRLHSKSFARKHDAEGWLADQEASKYSGSWADPSAARRPFSEWVDAWWAVWSSRPGLSPYTLQHAESRVRCYIRPYFARRRLGSLDVQAVQVWQNDLQRRAGYATVMACRSLLNRILQAAVDDRRLAFNAMSRVAAPKRPVDPEVVFGRVRRRAYTPEEFGRFLAACPAFYRDHFLVQAGTGLRPGELLGLHAFRVNLAQGRIEVQHVRYEAGTFGSGYRDRPKSNAGLRSVPMAPAVAAAVGAQARAAGQDRAGDTIGFAALDVEQLRG
jgi:integrase